MFCNVENNVLNCYNQKLEGGITSINKKFDVKNAESDKNKMSIIGIVKCNEGYLSFSDKRSSLICEDDLFEDNERGKINKAFLNDNILVTTCGNNYIGNIKIETVLSSIMKKANKIGELITMFEEELLNNLDNRVFLLYVVDKNFSKNEILCLKFEHFKLIETKVGYNYYIDGEVIYQKVLSDFLKDYFKRKKTPSGYYLICDDLKEAISKKINTLTEFLNQELTYNSVSKEIDFLFLNTNNI